MTTTTHRPESSTPTRTMDVLIVGAALPGSAAPCPLRPQAPGASDVTLPTAAPRGPFTCTSTHINPRFPIPGGEPTVLHLLRQPRRADRPHSSRTHHTPHAPLRALTPAPP